MGFLEVPEGLGHHLELFGAMFACQGSVWKSGGFIFDAKLFDRTFNKTGFHRLLLARWLLVVKVGKF